MANSPLPVALLPDPPRYAVEMTDEDYVILVVVPYNEGTVAEADRLAADRVAEAVADVDDKLADTAKRSENLNDLYDLDVALAVLNGLDRRILMLSADPAPANIPAGTIRVAKNTATGRLSLWANDGGTMVDLLSFTPAS